MHWPASGQVLPRLGGDVFHINKLHKHGVQLFSVPGSGVPLVQGCVGWLLCRLIPEPHNQQTYDLFIGEVTAAWADDRVFSQGRWHFDQADNALRTIHHVAGGSYLVSGDTIQG